MKEISLNGYLLEMYDSIEELPEERFQKFNRYAVIDAGIGSDIDSMARHINLILQYNQRGKQEDVAQAASNLLQCLTFVVNGISPEMHCFSAMVKSVNGVAWEDTGTSGAEKLTAMLSERGLTVGKVRGFIAHAKKKLRRNLMSFSRNWPAAGRRRKNFMAC